MTSINLPNNLKGIGATAFLKSELSNIILPNNLVTICDHAFENCKLKILTLPNSLNIIGEHGFYGIDFPAVVSLIEEPFSIYSVFSNNTLANATLYVPIGTIDKYKETYGWKKFLFIEEGNGPNGGDTPETKKCATPTIGYKNGKLTFNCATEDAVCHSTITNTDITSYSSNEVQLGVTYNISVYATKAGYENSETVTATLCWIDVDPKTEGITNNVAQVRSNAVIIQSSNGVVSVSGMDDGTNVAVYSTSGQMAAYAIASDNRALLSTHLIKGEIAIVKIGEKSVKVVMR